MKRKIRGHKRIWKNIERWRQNNLNLDITILKEYERTYTKVWVHPYSSLNYKLSTIDQPKRETKRRILKGLFDIYENWKTQLNELNQPYYLKIWLYESDISKSQIVCVIGDSIDFYKNTFNSPKIEEKFKPKYNYSTNLLFSKFNWEHKIEEEFIYSTDIGNIEDYKNENEYLNYKKWFNQKLKKNHTKSILKDGTECFAFTLGNIWIGE